MGGRLTGTFAHQAAQVEALLELHDWDGGRGRICGVKTIAGGVGRVGRKSAARCGTEARRFQGVGNSGVCMIVYT